MSKHTLPRLNQLAASIAVVAGGLALVPAAHAAAPTAGTNISNVASASYTDATNTSRTVTSNEVKTTVLQVASFLLEANRTTTANPNGQVSLPHTLTNLGNGSDTFTLNLTNLGGDDYQFSNIAIYIDANNDGTPDDNTNLIGQTISLGANQSVGLVVVGTTANTALNGNFGLLQVSATNVFTTTVAGGSNTATTANNTDRVNIVTGAVIQVVKSANVSNVDSTGTVAQRTVEYTLQYSNSGNSAATNVTLADVLPANVTYVPNSGVWSGSAVGRTDTVGDEVGAAYDFTTNTVNFVLGTVAQNTTGTLKFKVVVNSNAPAGIIPNTATVDPDGVGVGQPSQPTNTTTITVNSILKGTINDSQADPYADADATAAPAKDDTITAITSQGVPVNFGNNGGETIWIHNTGNVTETYNLSANKADLPAGSIVEIFKADGVTPLTDTNGDPVVDTGPIAAGSAVQVVIRVTLPSNYTGPIPVGDTLDTIVTIAPVNNATAIDTLKLSITAVTSARVDLSNGAGDEDGIQNDTPNAGEGAYVSTDIIDTRTTLPGQPASFPLAITNFGSNPDNFNLSSVVPSGWTVTYYTSNAAGVCSTNQVTNTGNILPGATAYLCATVTPPANSTPANSSDVVFTVSSPATGLTDSIKDRVIVSEVRNITITPDRQGQVAPGGTITYTHTLTNTGNVTEGVTGTSTLPFTVGHTGTLTGAITSVYVDLNNNGIADPTELVTGNDLTPFLTATPGGAGLQPGEAVTILVKVQAPSNATAGQEDNSTLVVTPTGNINGTAPSAPVQIVDKTTVNDGQVRLTKLQAPDVGCDGTADSAYGVAVLTAKPGTCISYQITAANDGNAPVTNVVISDAIPAYTTLQNPPVPALNPSIKGNVTINGTSLSSDAFGLSPLESVNLNFTVRIND